MQQAYTCLFGNEANKVVIREYIYLLSYLFCFLLFLMLLLVFQNNKTLSSVAQRCMPRF